MEAHNVIEIYAQAMQNWCNSSETDDTRKVLQIPIDARSFDSELFYLYVFLVSLSFEISYSDSKEVGVQMATSLIKRMDQLIAANSFSFSTTSPDMRNRYALYAKLRESGLKEFLEGLPRTFLLDTGMCRALTKDDLNTVGYAWASIPLWAGNFLEKLVDANRSWQKSNL